MGNLSGSELLILAVVFLLVFGANRLPEAGRAVGKGIREFRRALNEARDAVERPEAERPREAAPPKRLID
ncbi:MAG: Sec-independent protein translocase subunit TatA/TatB [Gemmatimonadales bacterium]